jgi:riboflavin synthase
MFTGIIQDVGQVVALERREGDLRLRIAVQRLDLAGTRPGDSIAVSGVCLTALDVDPGDAAAGRAGSFAADVSNETLSLTTLGTLQTGARVNLEPALRAGDALGGHLVSGHVDGLGELVGLQEDARSRRMRFACPPALARFLARKGSVAIDGVSLTVNDADDAAFTVNIIPHTWQVTTLGDYREGQRVNLEIDQIARYVERLLAATRTTSA